MLTFSRAGVWPEPEGWTRERVLTFLPCVDVTSTPLSFSVTP